MKIETIKGIGEIFKNVILTASILVGGIWTLYIFNERLESEKAEAELIALRQTLVQRPIITGELQTENIYDETNEAWIIKILLIVRNEGKMDTFLDFDANTLRVGKVVFEKRMISAYSNVTYNYFTSVAQDGEKVSNLEEIELVTLFSMQEKRFESVVKIKEDGVYQLQFIAKPGPQIRAARDSVGVDSYEIEKIDHWEFGLERILVLKR